MTGPGRSHVRQRHHNTALRKNVTLFTIMTEQRKQLAACRLSNKLLLCVHPSQLGTQMDFHVNALMCRTSPATTRRHTILPQAPERLPRQCHLVPTSTSKPSNPSSPFPSTPSAPSKPSKPIDAIRRQISMSFDLHSNPSTRSPSIFFVHPSLTSGFCNSSQFSWCDKLVYTIHSNYHCNYRRIQ